MRKKLVFLVCILMIYILIQILFVVFRHKYEIEYIINNFKIMEEYNYKINNTYLISIIHNDKVYSYQWEDKYLGKKIITDIKYYKDDNMECILPLFNNQVIFDLTCNRDNTLIYYHNMEEDTDIEAFIDSIDKYKYFNNNNTSSSNLDIYGIYLDNIDGNLAIETYKGIININKKTEIINLFNNDVYKKELSIFTKHYYIVPDYDMEYEFNKFYVVDLKNSKVKTIKMEHYISFESYIQGIDNDIIYLFDLENKKQYKIDIKELLVTEIGNLSSDINIYIDGKWDKKSVSDVIKKKYVFAFNNIREKIDNNTYMDSINNYIYTYKKSNHGYDVYKSNKYTPNIKNYLFSISDINSIIYVDDKIYFKKDNYIICYSEILGYKKIIQGNELLFNQDIKFIVI